MCFYRGVCGAETHTVWDYSNAYGSGFNKTFFQGCWVTTGATIRVSIKVSMRGSHESRKSIQLLVVLDTNGNHWGPRTLLCGRLDPLSPEPKPDAAELQ